MATNVQEIILVNAEEDYTEVRDVVIEISQDLNISIERSFIEFSRNLTLLLSASRVLLFVSDKVYGDMIETDLSNLSFEKIFNSDGSLAGPPYFYVSIPAENIT